jgi:hypothetical protein
LILDALKRNNTDAPQLKVGSNTLQDFFKYHEIVGPKYDKSYPGRDDSLIVEVNDFPVSAMPPFARQKFEENIKQALLKSHYRVLVLVDSVSKEELLKISN